MPRPQKINSDVNTSPAILGTFEGECADSNITNLNGLDITRPVWETVFASDEYKKGIELGHYIGFLGHPEDPNCMDFEHACIVMTEGHIDDAGKIQGKFNLIDTPVGRIVKTFQDAGVKFGISVRGAGDIIDNSVDPDTFVFRGFDLVSFPAYPESIPTFTEVAASTDANVRQKYKAVCAAVKENIEGLNTVESVDIIQKNFAKQSDEYKVLEERRSELENCNSSIDITAEKYNGVMKLYLEQIAANKSLKSDLANKETVLSSYKKLETSSSRKLRVIRRIYAQQVLDLQDRLNKMSEKNSKLRRSYRSAVTASTKLDNSVKDLSAEVENYSERISILESDNLKYKQKVASAQSEVSHKDSIISQLRSELDETVRHNSEINAAMSNRDESNRRLREQLTACKKLLAEYQDAYADIYANAVGASPKDIMISDSTSVSDIKQLILGSQSTSNDQFSYPTISDIDYLDDNDIVTL